jgi:DNA-binding IclR family transcriptional regulator
VKKVGPVLELFTPDRPEWRMTDIARALDTPKSSAHSLVSTLAEIGLLSVAPSGRYRLGLNLLTLSERMRANLDVLQYVTPSMRELAQTVGETVLLAMLDRREVVYVERVEGTHPMVRLAGVRPGARLSAHATAVGKVLLAFRDPVETRQLMATARFKQYTKHTIKDLDELEEALVEVRARGVAFDLQEVSPDAMCVAAPITDGYGAVIAGMSVCVPAYRFEAKRRELVPTLIDTAKKASRKVWATIAAT